MTHIPWNINTASHIDRTDFIKRHIVAKGHLDSLNLNPGAQILDIGSGYDSALVKIILEKWHWKNFKVTRVDIDPKTQDTLKGDITNLESVIKNNFADLVVCSELTADNNYLRDHPRQYNIRYEIKRILKSSGFLLVFNEHDYIIPHELTQSLRLNYPSGAEDVGADMIFFGIYKN